MFLLALPHNLISNRINVFPVLSHNNIKKGQKMVQVCMKILENVSVKEKKQTQCTKRIVIQLALLLWRNASTAIFLFKRCR